MHRPLLGLLRRIVFPTAANMCQSCEAAVPAGSRFCGSCGARVKQDDASRRTAQKGISQGHAELLDRWLEADVRSRSRLRPAVLGSVAVLVFVLATYAVFGVAPPEPIDPPRPRERDRSAPASNVEQQAPREKTIDAVPVVRPGRAPRVGAATSRALAPGVLQMLVTPWATVSIDGRGATPRARGADTLAAGIPHRLRFERPGFVTINSTVVLHPGERRMMEIRMTPMTP